LSPSRRRPHQPRFGVAVSSLPVLDTTGAGGGVLVDDDAPNVAGSRMVARRRGGSLAPAEAGPGCSKLGDISS
jgi:hypothetical protein